ncbi:hypothetical protein [Ferrimonas marina]|uniref:Uncharacterized protein n=1 Tax=Ferrimonas marina TaxID=299255 RepID=A0A1M5VL51_9GAMM|nr:hypothetical protein [Ferrimonas marina]SHH75908.1 hypothetical protein SAMN02745129_2835 [Ferrimonas marina]
MAQHHANVELFHAVTGARQWHARLVFWDEASNDSFHSEEVALSAESVGQAIEEAASSFGIDRQYIHTR